MAKTKKPKKEIQDRFDFQKLRNRQLAALLNEREKLEAQIVPPQTQLRKSIKDNAQDILDLCISKKYAPGDYLVGKIDFILRKSAKKKVVVDKKHIEEKDQLTFSYKRG